MCTVQEKLCLKKKSFGACRKTPQRFVECSRANGEKTQEIVKNATIAEIGLSELQSTL
jgi:hypothetical protein